MQLPQLIAERLAGWRIAGYPHEQYPAIAEVLDWLSGRDAGGPVDWQRSRRHGSHPFAGRLHRVRYEPGPLTPDAPAERARVWAQGAKIYD